MSSAEIIDFPLYASAESRTTSQEELDKILADPGFGRYFTDHMALIDWDEEQGWHNPRLESYHNLSLSPSASVLHYGQAIFEGLKAYRQPDGSIKTFRPEQNWQRMVDSARRLAMPEITKELFFAAIQSLVSQDQRFVPEAGGEAALYLRPFMIATEATLGVKPASQYQFILIASPVGAYFKGGIDPVKVWLSKDYVRAAPGGTGAAKFAGNYAASLLAQAQAADKGCDQVVWLDAIERTYVEEMGGMNLAFVFGEGKKKRLVTPELSGSLLPGVTRKSLLTLAVSEGFEVEERRISIQEWEEAALSGELTEVFACGTAAVITPVGVVKYEGGEFSISEGKAGAVTLALREKLTGIQRGAIADDNNWMHTLVEAE